MDDTAFRTNGLSLHWFVIPPNSGPTFVRPLPRIAGAQAAEIRELTLTNQKLEPKLRRNEKALADGEHLTSVERWSKVSGCGEFRSNGWAALAIGLVAADQRILGDGF